MEPTTSTTKSRLTNVALIGFGAAAMLASQQLLNTRAAAESFRFQNVHVWVASLNPDGGQSTYASRTCGYVLSADGGQRDNCTPDGKPMTARQGAAFEYFLDSMGFKAPR